MDISKEAPLTDFIAPRGPVPGEVPATDHAVVRSGLTLRYRIWGDRQKPMVLLQHGGRDHARSWDFVVAGLVDDYCVVTPDLRGHGDSEHVPGGGYDSLDYMTDFAAILEDLEGQGMAPPFRIIGHSLGGNIASHYAAAFPERVKLLVNIEGVGTPPALYHQMTEQPAGQRWREAAEKRLAESRRELRIFKTPELAVRRMKQLHARVPEEIVEHVALHAIRQREGGFSWKYDGMLGFSRHRPQSPEEYIDLYRSVSCPVLILYGTNSFTTPPDQDGRGQVFAQQKLITYEGAGHWLHHERLDDFMRDIRAFLSVS
ncbi:alpha/beta hydrolase [Parvularcula marina]|uniref:Alpha/beta hydrolase n=1 Tax=Parvularcula marina TaxID=2292771 RepID=A0A371R7Z2_9PROT|nr:alpha/beta hydrolase [Parvularcula marina]